MLQVPLQQSYIIIGVVGGFFVGKLFSNVYLICVFYKLMEAGVDNISVSFALHDDPIYYSCGIRFDRHYYIGLFDSVRGCQLIAHIHVVIDNAYMC